MPLEHVFLLFAKVTVAVTVLLALCGAAFLLAEWARVRRGREKSERAIEATRFGLSGFLFVGALFSWTSYQYLVVQHERHELLVEAQGISDGLDAKIRASVDGRVSYLHAQEIIREAINECSNASPVAEASRTARCQRLLAQH